MNIMQLRKPLTGTANSSRKSTRTTDLKPGESLREYLDRMIAAGEIIDETPDEPGSVSVQIGTGHPPSDADAG